MIDVVMITTCSRPALTDQALESLTTNAVNLEALTLTIVFDGYGVNEEANTFFPHALMKHSNNLVINKHRVGASRSRNIAASSIPKYRRQKYVMFCDDDCYFCPKWDEKLLELMRIGEARIVSGHGHPFNHGEQRGWPDRVSADYKGSLIRYTEPLVISSVHMLMSWDLWDDVGYFVEPGGPAGSEDYDYCMRAKIKGYGFAVTEPQCVIHAGMYSSNGNPIIGYSEVAANNERLLKLYGLEGKVRFE